MNRSSFTRAAASGVLALALLVTACDDNTPAEPELLDIPQTAASAGSFNTLVSLLELTTLDEALAAEGPFTVFAPTDEAFAALPDNAVGTITGRDQLPDVLLYHVVAGRVLAEDVVNLTSAATLQGSTIAIDASMGVKINDANIIQTDVLASNGVIHVIDKVLLPPGVDLPTQ